MNTSPLLAGFGRVDITPKLGCKLVGYGGRDMGATGVHDALWVRAMVLQDTTLPAGSATWVLVSADLCYIGGEILREIRNEINLRLGIPTEHILIATTHTHAGPDDGRTIVNDETESRFERNWDRSLADKVADAVATAYAVKQPATIGSATGILYGYSINRRWLDKPVDPGIAVLRVDDMMGKTLGVFSVFGCHSVVLGYDNYQISGDWPGNACQRMEETLTTQMGHDVTCLFMQGGAGDINPLVTGVRERMRNGHTVISIGNISANYGRLDDVDKDNGAWSIGDRGGGTFEEVAELGAAYAEEVLYTVSRIQPRVPAQSLWSTTLTVNAAAQPGEHPTAPKMSLITERPDFADPTNIPGELMVLRIGDMVLVTQPGEVFAETAIQLKQQLRALGVQTPALVTYANGFLLYLPEPEAFEEGGYEVDWPMSLGISRHFQTNVRAVLKPIMESALRL
ncbi:MAG: neutral/alkaline non-lysosomal ceramidase N-terminal domain-containing protein [Chloroflexota bacterium]